MDGVGVLEMVDSLDVSAEEGGFDSSSSGTGVSRVTPIGTLECEAVSRGEMTAEDNLGNKGSIGHSFGNH